MDESNEGCCELLENCSFYWSHRNHPWVIKNNVLAEYCHARPTPDNACSRVRYFIEFGEIPTPSLTPTGQVISDVESEIVETHHPLVVGLK